MRRERKGSTDRGRSLARRLVREQGGGMAIMGAAALPILMVIGVSAVELQQVWSDKSKTQDVADAAALMGSQQLSVTPDGAADRARAYAEGQLPDLMARSTVTVTAAAAADQVMKVSIDTHRLSFFANLLPPGGFRTHAEATAKSASMSPLCVLTIGDSAKADDLELTASARLEAPACMTHANRDIKVANGALLSAALSEAGGAASGPVTPVANVGAPLITDPFADLDLTFPTTCGNAVTDVVSGVVPVQAGLHCADVKVSKTGTLQLAAGTHYFKGKLEVKDTARLDGTAGVTLIFALDTELKADPGAMLDLKGAKTGKTPGFVIIAARDYIKDFHLASDPIAQITGTVYVPSARLLIDGGKKKTGQTSPWTVVAAKGLAVNDTASLVINANYATTDVPVPDGVGTKIGNSRLIR